MHGSRRRVLEFTAFGTDPVRTLLEFHVQTRSRTCRRRRQQCNTVREGIHSGPHQWSGLTCTTWHTCGRLTASSPNSPLARLLQPSLALPSQRDIQASMVLSEYLSPWWHRTLTQRNFFGSFHCAASDAPSRRWANRNSRLRFFLATRHEGTSGSVQTVATEPTGSACQGPDLAT